jgi:hypothetical protein
MKRKTPDEKVERFFHADARTGLAPVRTAIADYATGRVAYLSAARPSMPVELSDRQEEALLPLIAIADDLGRDWPEAARNAAVVLCGRGERLPDHGTQILADLKRVWAQIEGEREHTHVLADLRNALEDPAFPEPLEAHTMSVWMRRFDIRPEPNGFHLHGQLRRGYRRGAFDDAFRRYVRP